MPAARPLPQTLGELRTSTQFPEACLKMRTIKDEMRGNLIARLQNKKFLSMALSATKIRSYRRS